MPEQTKRPVTYRGKCIICGDATVGKSALIQVFCSDGAQYPKTYTMTTGTNLTVKNVAIPESADCVELYLYDCAGQDTFQDIVDTHMKGANIVAYIFDVTNETSFKNITIWHKKMEAANADKELPGVLIGNKYDLNERIVVTDEMGEELASKLGLQYFVCSAKELQQIDTPFLYLAKEFHQSQ